MLDYLFQILEDNQFAQGGLFLAIFGTAVMYLRRLPVLMWGWLERRITVRVEVMNHTDLFDWVADAIQKNGKANYRSMTVKAIWNEKKERQIVRYPAQYLSVFYYGGRRFVMFRSQDSGAFSLEPRETLTIQTMRWNKNVLDSMLEDAMKIGIPSNGKNRLYAFNSAQQDWQKHADVELRLLTSVVFRHSDQIIADVQKFLDGKNRYVELGIPYHRGYLFHGPPGNGKTSMVSAMAKELGLNLCMLQLTDTDDQGLMEALSTMPPKSLLVLEDVDCVMPERDSNGRKGVTMSGLLNAIDGLATPSGQIIVMTTNYVDQLDSALKRPGRCDMVVEFDFPGGAERTEMHRRFQCDMEIEQFLRQTKGMSMAEVQNLLQEAV